MQIIEADHYTILYCGEHHTAYSKNATTTVMKNERMLC
jgi:hypothetical protein